MAATRTRGCSGKVYVKDLATTSAATQTFGVSGWEFTETADRPEASEIGDCTKTYIAGAVETAGTLNLWWDTATGANQADLSIANECEISIYPAGPTSGATKYVTPTGGAVITEVARKGGTEGAVSMTVNFTINGSMTATAVP